MSSNKSIGIKLYNDKFYPILNSQENKIKKLELTTIRDNQEKAIIELYEGTSDKCINNEYLGKLVIDFKRKTQKGEPGIEVHIRQDDNGMIYAKAWDTESNEQSEIQIEHSNTLIKTRLHEETLSDEEINRLQDTPKETIKDYDKELKRNNVIQKIVIISIALLLAAILTLLIFLGVKKGIPALKNTFANMQQKSEMKKQEKEKERQKQKEIEKKEKAMREKEKQESKQLSLDLDDKKVEPTKAVETKKEPIGTRNLDGKRYYIRWGDNLWNICQAQYNDPWYYPSLAEANNIENPRLIFAGTYIKLPPKKMLKRWEFVE